VFREQPDGFEFVEHQTHQKELPGHVLVLPLAVAEQSKEAAAEEAPLALRDPLTTPREEAGEGARHKEAAQFAELLQTIASDWSVNDERTERRATYGDIMVLVRSRTHLQIYEEALRAKHIPFISSRRGGLLDTLEAEDVQALLLFLITPFADLALAQVLRTPIFACSDADLMLIAGSEGLKSPVRPELVEGQSSIHGSTSSPRTEEGQRSSWWQRLQHLADPSPALQRAAELLRNWLALADKLPVHDLLDRIYFEGDVLARYSAVLPLEMRAKVTANLHAFMKMALDIDAGRYPSLPRFLQDLRELRDSTDDAPDEGKLGTAGDAVRIYTVHESKGLEAPIVWLLDANAEKNNKDGNDVLLDWPTHEPQPLHFSLYTDQASRGKQRAPLFEQDAMQQAREEMNLLYVAMTRAQQALIVSGNSKGEDKEEKKKAQSWYDRIAAVVGERTNPLHVVSPRPQAGEGQGRGVKGEEAELLAIHPTGKRAGRNTVQQQRGIWLHALLQHLTTPSPLAPLPQAGEGSASAREREIWQQRLGIPSAEMESLWQQAQHLLTLPQLARFFDAQQHRSASNEMSYINAKGELKRIDRLVEFDDEVWVLDYKLGAPKVGNPLSAEADAELTHSEDAARYRAQMQEYQTAMETVYAGKTVRCALVFADGVLSEV
jgi:ATP-dependent helicase/nuclease subunit A